MLGDRRRRRDSLRARHRGPDAAREPAWRAAAPALGQRARVRGAGDPPLAASRPDRDGVHRPRQAMAERHRRIVQRQAARPAPLAAVVRNRTDAKVSIEAWRRHYNEVRPHSSLGYLTPAEFKAKHLAGSIDRGRSPAMPARAGRTKNEEPLTGSLGAVLQ